VQVFLDQGATCNETKSGKSSDILLLLKALYQPQENHIPYRPTTTTTTTTTSESQ